MDDSSPGNEEKIYPASNWVQFVLNLPIDSQKITLPQWNYFTGGVILTGDIVNKSVPGGIEKYAHNKLFAPLGITKYKWQYTPQKNVNTAGGLKLSALDLAKFGQLYLDQGIHNGTKIFDASWAYESFMHHAVVDNARNENYGYLFWNKSFVIGNSMYETYYCAGNGGSKVYIFPKDNVVIVITATAYNQMFMHSQVDKMMEKYILPAVFY
jgi:CubicO group peptidase (beta-lactamase class C family)